VTLNKRTRIRTAAAAVGVLLGLATGIGGYTEAFERNGVAENARFKGNGTSR